MHCSGSGITVKFSQEEYMVDEYAGSVSLQVMISNAGERKHSISFRYKVFVSDNKFSHKSGLCKEYLSKISYVYTYSSTVWNPRIAI